MSQRVGKVKDLLVPPLAIGLALFHLITSLVGELSPLPHRALHFLIAAYIIFLSTSLIKGRKQGARLTLLDITLLVLLTAAVVNIFFRYEAYLTYVVPLGADGAFFAVTVVVVAIIAAYRTTGLVFPALIIALIIYTQLGTYIPGVFGHPPISWSRVLTMIYMQGEGAWGAITGISSTILAIFLVFGALLQVTGGGEGFVKLAYVLVGRKSGGPALVAVIASALFGTISGSSVANVLGTGVFTIPMMKKCGYRPAFAGAVESFSSTGGQFTPPIMASTAFIMAELLSINYLVIVVAVIIPCVLYYASGFFHIFSEARRLKLKPIPEDEIPRWKDVLKWSLLGPLFLPIGLLFFLLIQGWSLGYAAGWASLSAIALRLLSNHTLAGLKTSALKVVKALESGGRLVANIAVLLVAAQIAVGLINLTGLGVKFGMVILGAGSLNMFIAVFLTAVLVLFLGLGLPTAGVYVIGAAVGGTALIQLGLPPIPVHLLIIFYSALAQITPPVCLACFAAEAISGASSWSIARIACGRLALVAYILPFFWLVNPDLLILGREPSGIVVTALSALFGVALIAQATAGFWTLGSSRLLNPAVRLLCVAAGMILLLPWWQGRLIGFVIGIAILVWERARYKAGQVVARDAA